MHCQEINLGAYIIIRRTLKLLFSQGSTINIACYYSSVKSLTSITIIIEIKGTSHYWAVVICISSFLPVCLHIAFVTGSNKFVDLYIDFTPCEYIHLFSLGRIISRDNNLTSSLLFGSGTNSLTLLFLWMISPIGWDVLLLHHFHQAIIVLIASIYCCCR